MSLRNRLRPWHALMLVVFVAGAGSSVLRAGQITTMRSLLAVASGLFAVVLFQLTVGNVWGYAIEYANAGGQWTDAPFLAPFVIAGVVGVALGIWFESVALGAWVAFWIFVLVAALVALGVWLSVGYHESIR